MYEFLEVFVTIKSVENETGTSHQHRNYKLVVQYLEKPQNGRATLKHLKKFTLTQRFSELRRAHKDLRNNFPGIKFPRRHRMKDYTHIMENCKERAKDLKLYFLTIVKLILNNNNTSIGKILNGFGFKQKNMDEIYQDLCNNNENSLKNINYFESASKSNNIYAKQYFFKNSCSKGDKESIKLFLSDPTFDMNFKDVEGQTVYISPFYLLYILNK